MVQYIKDGNVLECPENTPKSVYKLMTMCWSSSPANRPCFRSSSIITFTADADADVHGGEKLQGSQLHTIEFIASMLDQVMIHDGYDIDGAAVKWSGAV